MPLVHFVDEELIEEAKRIPKSKESKENENKALEEHQFIANCLQIGLRIEDLKQLKYKDVAKIMLCFIDKKKSELRRATQSDWDKLAGRR